MESNPALAAILSGVTNPAERERIAQAFHSLSQGDEMSFPVVFALVANGTARSVAQSAAAIRESAERIQRAATAPAQSPAVSQIRAVDVTRKPKRKAILVGTTAGLLVSTFSISGGFFVMRNHFEAKAAALAAQHTASQDLVENLRTSGGELRFYATRDAAGKAVRTVAIDAGTRRPLEAFLNAAGQAIVLLEPVANDVR